MKPFILGSNRAVKGQVIDSENALKQLGWDANTGNGYISYGINRSIFGTDQKAFEYRDLFDLQDIDNLVNLINGGRFSHLFISFQSHIYPGNNQLNWNALERLVSQIKIPVLVFSLGAICDNHQVDMELDAKLSDQMISCLRTISLKSIQIGIRGEYTKSILDKIGVHNTTIIGCPSFFEMGENRKKVSLEWDEQKNILALGWFSNRAMSKKLHYIFQDATQDSFFYKLSVSNFDFSKEDLSSLGIDHFDNYLKDGLSAFFDSRTQIFADYDLWKSYIFGKFNLAIGTRFHGSVIAINSGVPAILTNGDIRTKELSDYLNIPHRPDLWKTSQAINLRELHDNTDFSGINSSYPDLYQNYRNWLLENGISIEKEKRASGMVSFAQKIRKIWLQPAQFKQRSVLETNAYLAEAISFTLENRFARINLLEQELNIK
jgi:hypothetical protein